MKKLLFTFVFCALTMLSFAQSGQVTRKIVIRSADPQLIAMILAGKYDFNMSPNPTSLMRMGNGGNGFGGGGFGNSSGGNGFGGTGSGFGNGSSGGRGH